MDVKAYSWDVVAEIACKYDLEPCLLDALARVEAVGNGFLPDSRPKILFEGHIFWRELKKIGIDPAPFSREFPDIVFPKWTRQYYKGGSAEYERLEQAKVIEESAAYQAASWGAFQIMGFNYGACGFASVHDFVAAMSCGFKEQLEASVNFLTKTDSVRFLRNHDWATFAKRYNGPGYAQNKYDEKLKAAYNKCLLTHP